jgi:hypothetical protein
MLVSLKAKWSMMAAYFVACFGLLLMTAGGVTVNLQAYITFSLLTSNGVLPLADGSVVYIIGSLDANIDPMQVNGTPATNYIADSTSGDDIIVGVTAVYAAQLNSNGTFYAGDFYYEDDLVDYLYIRFFDSPAPITGLVNWGTSPITNVGDLSDCCALGVIEVDFVGNLAATNYNNFVVIPEPSTINLLVLCGGLFSALGVYRKRALRAARPPGTPGAHSPGEDPPPC